MSVDADRLTPRRGRYGVDGPPGVVVLGAIVAALLGGGAAGVRAGARRWPPLALAAGGIAGLGLGTYLHTTLRGKFMAWAELLAGLGLRGDERVLDLGCGRGAVLMAAARWVPRGMAVGVDIWQAVDQSGNDPRVTRRNAELEGVADLVWLETADIRRLPLATSSFDVVVSSLAIHNINGREQRRRALAEAVRVLRPGGRLLIVDLAHTGEYAAELAHLGLVAVTRRRLDRRFWFFGPALVAHAVGGVKPG